jgi:hypothetical protein
LRAFVLSFLLTVASCTSIRTAFDCHGDETCFDGTRAGSCEATGWCAFPDDSCPSGRRYGVYAGGGLGQTCVGSTIDTDGGVVSTCGLIGDPCCADMSCPSLTCDPAGTCSGCILQLSLGDAHGCALKHDGTVWCWGKNDHGQIGDSSTIDRPVAVQVGDGAGGFLHAIESITSGAHHTCALQAGQIFCWGDDTYGQLGRNVGGSAVNSTPMPARLAAVVAVAAGANHVCATDTNKLVWCWGANDSGQLSTSPGDPPSMTPVVTPTASLDKAGVQLMGVSLGAGLGHTCLIKADHTLWCWGSDTAGELGDATTSASGPPEQVAVIGTHAVAVAGGVHVTCVLTDDSKVSCVGLNDHAQAGQPASPAVAVPMALGFDGATEISLGGTQSCARRVGGRLNCWGNDQAPMDQMTGVATVGVGAGDRCVAQANAIACTSAMPRLACP